MADVIRGQWVCVDCLVFIANGDLPDDEEAAAAVVAGCKREAPYQWVCDGPHTGEHAPRCGACLGDGADDSEEDGVCHRCEGTGKVDEVEGADSRDFSWSSCDCCGSTLGGSRHRCALILVGGKDE